VKEQWPSILRGFTSIDEGQVHYREAGNTKIGQPPLVMFHASPGSAKSLEPLIQILAMNRRVIALDTLGNGDSCAPWGDEPDLAYFARAHVRALTALGIDRFDVWGSHTGANIACEIAIQNSTSVRGLIIDGIGLYAQDEQEDLLRHYLPTVQLDQNGTQFHQLWAFVRDAYLFWPWYKKDSEHRRPAGLPSATDLHNKAVEVFKAANTFQKSYRAALSYQKAQKLPLIQVPTLVTCSKSDMLFAYFQQVCNLIPSAESNITAGTSSVQALLETTEIFERFLEKLPPES
jgi:pimeloyl-ACP methyl ester carboxylesterase